MYIALPRAIYQEQLFAFIPHMYPYCTKHKAPYILYIS